MRYGCIVGVVLLGVLCAGCLHSKEAGGEMPVSWVDVFVGGEEGYHTYRIPAMITAPNGDLLAICEGRKTGGGDHGDIDLVMKRSTDAGASWGPLELIYEEGGTEKITIGNPCPVVDADTGILWLPFCRDNDAVFMMHSKDSGHTWSTPVNITAAVKDTGKSWYATGPGVGIQKRFAPHKGRLIIPCDHRRAFPGVKKTCVSHVFYSDDHGATWQLGGSVGMHTDECQVVETSNGDLLINMRNYWERNGGIKEKGHMRTSAISTDGGATWGALRFEKTLVEPVCQASLLSVPSPKKGGPDYVLFSNPADVKRQKMTVRLSRDEGATWCAARQLCDQPAAYSCLVALPKGQVGCFYERGLKRPYETITFARFPLSWLTDPASN